MQYIITIVNKITNTVQHLERDESDIDKTIQKELGGWDQLHSASTSGVNSIKNEYMMAGTTKDGSKAFSIICITDNRITEMDYDEIVMGGKKLKIKP